MLTKRDYQDALDVQSACNLSGVINSFVRVLERVRAEVQGTDAINKHPICRLYAEQIIYLTGGGSSNNSESYNDAYVIAEQKSNGENNE